MTATAPDAALDIDALAEHIDALLPQTQCTRCGYPGCAPYARAIAEGRADIDRCPPGGDALVAALARLAGRTARPVDRSCGEPGPLRLAAIDETTCIGCTLCIVACPVDAIIGAPKRMHAVLPSLCSGCELCVPACPVDCIAMHPARRDWSAGDARSARERHHRRNARIARNERIANRRPPPAAQPGPSGPTADGATGQQAPSTASSPPAVTEAAQRKAAVDAALARARARREAASRR